MSEFTPILIYLGWIGCQPVEALFVTIGQLSSVLSLFVGGISFQQLCCFFTTIYYYVFPFLLFCNGYRKGGVGGVVSRASLKKR